MKNDKFRQFCSPVNYNTYNKIQNAFLLYWSHVNAYSKNNKLRELYQEFIKNYNKLNKVFDLNDPIQIHTMFNYLLLKGYLSKDKNFEFSGKQAKDIYDLDGINVITGKAVCRHISAMLNDILNEYGIEAIQLGVYSKNINILDEEKDIKDVLLDNYNNNSENSYELTEVKNPLVRKIGNHSILFAFKDGKSYFLDPTQSRIYRMNESSKSILYDDKSEVPIRLLSSLVLNKPKDYLRIRERLSSQYPTVTQEEEKSITTKTMSICNDNIDIFEQFYNENSELYNDISNRILKIKKRKLITR